MTNFLIITLSITIFTHLAVTQVKSSRSLHRKHCINLSVMGEKPLWAAGAEPRTQFMELQLLDLPWLWTHCSHKFGVIPESKASWWGPQNPFPAAQTMAALSPDTEGLRSPGQNRDLGELERKLPKAGASTSSTVCVFKLLTHSLKIQLHLQILFGIPNIYWDFLCLESLNFVFAAPLQKD